LWLHSLKVAQLLRSAACLHTNQSRSYLNHLVVIHKGKAIPVHARTGPEGSRRLSLADFKTIGAWRW